MPTQPLGPTGLLAQSMTLPAGSQSMAMGGMGLRAQGMDGRKKGGAVSPAFVGLGFSDAKNVPFSTFVPSQTQIGDLVIFLGTLNGSAYPPSNSATWNAMSASMPATGGWFGWKIWTAADFVATTSGTAGSFPSVVVWVFRGIRSATMKIEFGDLTGGGVSGQVLNIGAFTKSPLSNLCGIFVVSTADASQQRAISAPVSLSSSVINAPSDQIPISQQYKKMGSYTLSPSAYTSGASISYDLGTTSWTSAVVQVVELFA
jgi:hypothetical protein